ncbi:hypothetical protein F4809DRAFT_651150 [Biscogniauxia mediterranea]|nr:hypothetical protein F4809DRAFT_651150 [Biscogniauxia mediterranea]
MSTNSRVCDRCIRFIWVGDLRRPRCTRCFEVGFSCTYSTERRKPGPARGSRRQIHADRMGETGHSNSPGSPHNDQDGPEDLDSIQSSLGDTRATRPSASQTTPSQATLPDFNQLGFSVSPHGSIDSHQQSQARFPGYYLEPQQERQLLVHFFDEVHSAIPLFQKDKFLKRYDSGLVYPGLVLTIVAITAKILGPISYWKSEDIHECIVALLKTTSDRDSSSTRISLDEFKRDCILVYYEFHQYPGPSSWMKINGLTRRAQLMGLNQIDNPELCSAFDIALVTEDDIEDWRSLFWCIYALDCYSNVTCGAPFMIDLDSINTALLRRSNNDDGDVPVSVPKIYLPDEPDRLWKTVQDIVSSGCAVDYNIHMVTTTVLRQTGRILRLRTEGKRLPYQVQAVKNLVTTLRLSLPPRYLNPSRNVLKAESQADHHTRLTNILHLHMARFTLTMPQDLGTNEAEWMENWHQSLETCQDIVLVVEQWNNHFSPRVDPAICFIGFSALTMLELHRRSVIASESPLLASLNQSIKVLLLFLEHFATMWAVPKLLIRQFKNYQTDIPLTYMDIDLILNRLKTPLHPKAVEVTSPMALDGMESLAYLDMAVYFPDTWSFDIVGHHV